jgi:hypothetical protein
MPLVIWAHQGRLDREPYCRLMVQKNSVLVSSKSAVFIISKSHRAWVSALSPKVRKYCSVVSIAGCVYNPRPLAEFVPKAYTSTGISGFLKAVGNSVAPLMPSSFNDAGEMSPVDAVLSLSQVLLAHMKSQHMRSALTCVGKGPSRLLASFGRLSFSPLCSEHIFAPMYNQYICGHLCLQYHISVATWMVRTTPSAHDRTFRPTKVPS